MKYVTKNISGFTLMELIVVMIISSIVISFTYMTFSIFEQSILSKRELENQITSTYLFLNIFKSDLDGSSNIIEDNGELHLLNEKKIITYSFNQGKVIRKSEATSDTFQIKSINHELTWINKEKQLSYYFISINVHIDDDTIPIYFNKVFPSDYELNNQLN